MVLLCRSIINFIQLTKCRHPPPELLFSFSRKLLPVSQFQQKKQFGSSVVRFEEKVPSSLFKYEKFSEKTAPVILDVEEEREKAAVEERIYDEFEGISLERGTTGVIDVEEIVELLKREKGQNIIVIQVPPRYNYVDYKVIVTGRSHRHMYAMADFLRRLFKRRARTNQLPKIEGKNCKSWIAVDLGNIVLHIFSAGSRKVYDLETLWSVGKDYDTIIHKKDTSHSDLSDYAEVLASLNPNN